MTYLNEGDKAPAFSLPCDDRDAPVRLKDFKGKKLVIFFYPKDNTPGCTTESCSFRDFKSEFSAIDTEIIGVSKDSIKSHTKFREKQNLNFPLLSDEESTMCENYGVWVEKNMYGRKYMGIERSTFLINEDGIIIKIWRKVKVNGHVEDVLNAVSALRKTA